MRTIVSRTHGRQIKSTGDGFLVVYDSAARALGAATKMRDAAASLGLEIRVAAAPGEVWVSDVTRLLAAGAGLEFAERGEHRLRGLEQQVRLFALEEGAGRPVDSTLG